MSVNTYRGALGKVELTVTKDHSGSDPTLVVASGATVAAYRQGATVRTATTVTNGSTTAIPIYDPGDIRVGDTLQVNSTATPSVTVTAIAIDAALDWTVTVHNTSGSSFVTALYDRLVNASRRPTLYRESQGASSLGGSSTTTDSNGAAKFYTPSPLLDLVISGSGVITQVLIDQASGASPLQRINVLDFAGSLVEALKYVNAEGRTTETYEIYVPPGLYIFDGADLPIVLDKRVNIIGAGAEQSILIVNPTAGNEDKHLFHITSGVPITIQGFGIQHCGASLGAGDGASIMVSSPYRVTLRDLDIQNSPSYGIGIGYLTGIATQGDFTVIDSCRLRSSYSNSLIAIGQSSTFVEIRNSRILGDTCAAGVYAISIQNSANIWIFHCDGSPSDTSTPFLKTIKSTGSGGTPEDFPCNLTIEDCDWEHSAASGTLGAGAVPMLWIEGVSNPVVRDTLIFQADSGIYFKGCSNPIAQSVVFKDMGSDHSGAGYDIKFEDCVHPGYIGVTHEKADGATNRGRRERPVIVEAGYTAGLYRVGSGLQVPRFATDAERDTAPSATTDDKRPLLTNGTLIWVDSPTSPTSKLQVYNGSAWKGVGDQAGAAIT